MEALIGTGSIFLFVLLVVIAVLAFLLPIYVYQIRNKTLAMDKKLGEIIELLSRQGGKIKTCPFCGTRHQLADITCTNCGKAIGL